MRHFPIAFFLTVLVASLIPTEQFAIGQNPERVSTDLAVYGATPSGIAAAIACADAGHDVLVIDPTSRIGGLLTNGVSHSDFRSFEALSGFFWDFSKRVENHYRSTYGQDSEQLQHCFRGTHGEPSVNLQILESMLAERARIRVLRRTRLISLKLQSLAAGRHRIDTTVFSTGLQVQAKQFIDASYEGDLMYLAGENFHVGRESRQQYNEPLAGNSRGEADGQVQGYNYRFTMTQIESNKRMPEAPDGYNREDFLGVLRHFESKTSLKVFASGHDGIFRAHLPLMPNGKADINDTPRAPVRLSMPDINDDYPNADSNARDEIVRQHHYYNIGLLYFLQNDSAVPVAIQQDARAWGFCKDEFTENGGIPEQLYIREARRMIGQHVFTGNDTLQSPDDARSMFHPNSIACGDYIHNCHGTGRKGTRFDGQHEGEFYKPVAPYQIPYGVIVPTKSTNMLVPVACSASHFGFSALRLEPIWCSLGQAAGEAAALAIEKNETVQNLPVKSLQKRLHANRSATIYVSDVSPDSLDFGAVQWLGSLGGLHGLHDANQPKATPIMGQYSQAHPGHTVELGKAMDHEVLSKWSKLLKITSFRSTATRRDTIRQAFNAIATMDQQ